MPLSRKVISEEEEISLKMTLAQPFNESLTALSAATLPGRAEGPLPTPVSLAPTLPSRFSLHLETGHLAPRWARTLCGGVWVVLNLSLPTCFQIHRCEASRNRTTLHFP